MSEVKMTNYMTLEDGEYQAESDDGGVHVSRESALGIATVRLRADYAAAPELAEALRLLIHAVDAPDTPGRDGIIQMRTDEARAALAKAGLS